MKKDVFGRPLEHGDLVVVKGAGATALALATVVRVTPQKIRVIQLDDTGLLKTWSHLVSDAVFVLKAAEATPENCAMLAAKVKENKV